MGCSSSKPKKKKGSGTTIEDDEFIYSETMEYLARPSCVPWSIKVETRFVDALNESMKITNNGQDAERLNDDYKCSASINRSFRPGERIVLTVLRCDGLQHEFRLKKNGQISKQSFTFGVTTCSPDKNTHNPSNCRKWAGCGGQSHKMPIYHAHRTNSTVTFLRHYDGLIYFSKDNGKFHPMKLYHQNSTKATTVNRSVRHNFRFESIEHLYPFIILNGTVSKICLQMNEDSDISSKNVTNLN